MLFVPVFCAAKIPLTGRNLKFQSEGGGDGEIGQGVY